MLVRFIFEFEANCEKVFAYIVACKSVQTAKDLG